MLDGNLKFPGERPEKSQINGGNTNGLSDRKKEKKVRKREKKSSVAPKVYFPNPPLQQTDMALFVHINS